MIDPQNGYITYIINPKSGASSSKLVVHGFLAWLIQKGFAVKAIKTESLIHARELAAAVAGDANCSCVIAAGGDGTIREAAHGLQGSGRPLLMIPAGTENLLASELGFDERLSTLTRTFEEGYIRDMDLGTVNGRCFASIAGVGFDGDIVKLVSSRRNGHIHHFDYFWPIWRTFFNARFPVMKVEADGKAIFEGPCMAFVGNISRYAMGLQILNRADYGDGLLDVCIYRCNSKPRLVKHSLMTIFKRHTAGSDVVYCQAKDVRITSVEQGVASEIDGDPGPSLPLHINIIPHAVRVIVPKGAEPAGIRTKIKRMLG
jgi:YegS/Rv2252/BmrU family lipid kinase